MLQLPWWRDSKYYNKMKKSLIIIKKSKIKIKKSIMYRYTDNSKEN